MELELGDVMIGKSEIKSKIGYLAQSIREEYGRKMPVFIGLLTGSFIFCADLVREFGESVSVAFIKASSYDGTSTTGKVAVTGLDALNLKDQRVLLVEDIVDTGLTLSSVIEQIKQKSPKDVKVVALLDKPSRRKADIKPDFAGFSIPDHFVVGYGLDCNEQYRNLPDIHQMRIR
jgi:hypoxanthine phosphoribosyltransferase